MEPPAAGTRKPPPPLTALVSDTTSAVAVDAAAAPQAPALSLVAAGLMAVSIGGGALLVWWVDAFHRANARLWMVPVGLVLLGTPLVACLSVFASGPCERSSVPPPPAALGA